MEKRIFLYFYISFLITQIFDNLDQSRSQLTLLDFFPDKIVVIFLVSETNEKNWRFK